MKLCLNFDLKLRILSELHSRDKLPQYLNRYFIMYEDNF